MVGPAEQKKKKKKAYKHLVLQCGNENKKHPISFQRDQQIIKQLLAFLTQFKKIKTAILAYCGMGIIKAWTATGFIKNGATPGNTWLEKLEMSFHKQNMLVASFKNYLLKYKPLANP